MDNRNTPCSAQMVALAFLGGALVGAIAGILLAPKSGEETRYELRRYAKKTEDEVIERAREARASLDEIIERGKHFVAEKRAEVDAAFVAGKEAVKEKWMNAAADASIGRKGERDAPHHPTA